MKEHWEYLVGIAALIGALWGQIKSVLQSLGNLIVVTVEVDSDLARAVISQLRARRQQSVDGTYYMDRLPIRAEKNYRWVPYKDWNIQSRFFRCGKSLLRYATEVVDKNNSSTTKFKFSFIRGTIDWLALIDTSARNFRLDGTGGAVSWESYRHKIVYHHGASFSGMGDRNNEALGKERSKVRWSAGSLCTLIGRQPMEIGDWGAASASYVMPKGVQAVSHEVETWMKSQDWYEQRGLSWRRGLLLESDPGMGKTAYARYEAIKHDLPVHVMDLASLSNQELRRAWQEATESIPCMVLIEDIDRVFDGEKNVAASSRGITDGALTFDTLLNTIDGIEQHNGVFLVVTTNNLKKVDSALIRPSRLDRIIKFPRLERDDALAIARNILGSGPVANRIVNELGDCRAADLQEACCRIALEELFRQESEQVSQGPAPELTREAGNHRPTNGVK